MAAAEIAPWVQGAAPLSVVDVEATKEVVVEGAVDVDVALLVVVVGAAEGVLEHPVSIAVATTRLRSTPPGVRGAPAPTVSVDFLMTSGKLSLRRVREENRNHPDNVVTIGGTR